MEISRKLLCPVSCPSHGCFELHAHEHYPAVDVCLEHPALRPPWFISSLQPCCLKPLSLCPTCMETPCPTFHVSSTCDMHSNLGDPSCYCSFQSTSHLDGADHLSICPASCLHPGLSPTPTVCTPHTNQIVPGKMCVGSGRCPPHTALILRDLVLA